MDVKDAIQLVASGRLTELDLEVLWEVESILAASSDPAAQNALRMFLGSGVGSNLSTMSLQMQNIITANVMQIQNIEKRFSIFALDKSGRPLNSELSSIFNFFQRVEIDNKKTAEPVKTEKLFMQAAEVARATALKDLYLDKNFAKSKPEEQKKTYINTIVMAMEENAFVLISNQISENVLARNNGPISPFDQRKIENIAKQQFASAIDAESNAPIKLSNTNVIGTFVAETNRLGNLASIIQEKTKTSKLVSDVMVLDKKLSSQYRNSFMVLRPFAKTPKMSFIAGSVGKSSFAADSIAEAIRSNNPAKKQNKESMFNFFKARPATLALFSSTVVSSIKKIYGGMAKIATLNLATSKIARGWRNIAQSLSAGNKSKTKNQVVLKEKTILGNLSIMSASMVKILNEPKPGEQAFMWKDFNAKFLRSSLGRALNPQSMELVSERPEDYKIITPIILSKEPKSQRVGGEIPLIHFAPVAPRVAPSFGKAPAGRASSACGR